MVCYWDGATLSGWASATRRLSTLRVRVMTRSSLSGPASKFGQPTSAALKTAELRDEYQVESQCSSWPLVGLNAALPRTTKDAGDSAFSSIRSHSPETRPGMLSVGLRAVPLKSQAGAAASNFQGCGPGG